MFYKICNQDFNNFKVIVFCNLYAYRSDIIQIYRVWFFIFVNCWFSFQKKCHSKISYNHLLKPNLNYSCMHAEKLFIFRVANKSVIFFILYSQYCDLQREKIPIKHNEIYPLTVYYYVIILHWIFSKQICRIYNFSFLILLLWKVIFLC